MPPRPRQTSMRLLPLLRAPLCVLLCALCLRFPSARAQDFSQTHEKPNPQNDQRAAANEALQAGDYARALALLKPLADASSTDAVLLYDLGSAQDVLEQADAAAKSYRAASAVDANLLEPRVALGLMLARTGHAAEARTEFAAAVALEKSTTLAGDQQAAGRIALLKARAYRSLARLDQHDRPTDARDELLAALKLSPETSDDTLLAAELAGSSSGGSDASEAAYRRVLSEKPNDPTATAALVHLLLAEKRQPEAERALRDALAANPGNSTLTAQLAGLLSSEGKVQEALPLAQAVHNTNPDDLNVDHLLATLDLQTGHYAEAEPLLAKVELARPADPSIATDRGDALIHLKRYAEAERLLTRFVTQPTLFATPADLGAAAGELAFAAAQNNDPQEALHALDVRATVLPSTGATLFLAAISNDKLHRTKQAIEAYKAFLAAANGQMPDQEFEARHRLVALEH